MSLALPPVGVQSTAEQLLQTTTLWEWLNTVVLRSTIPLSAHILPCMQCLSQITLFAAAGLGKCSRLGHTVIPVCSLLIPAQ